MASEYNSHARNGFTALQMAMPTAHIIDNYLVWNRYFITADKISLILLLSIDTCTDNGPRRNESILLSIITDISSSHRRSYLARWIPSRLQCHDSPWHVSQRVLEDFDKTSIGIAKTSRPRSKWSRLALPNAEHHHAEREVFNSILVIQPRRAPLTAWIPRNMYAVEFDTPCAVRSQWLAASAISWRYRVGIIDISIFICAIMRYIFSWSYLSAIIIDEFEVPSSDFAFLIRSITFVFKSVFWKPITRTSDDIMVNFVAIKCINKVASSNQ